jgi:enoyl-[acyl-carrier protein] reductase II
MNASIALTGQVAGRIDGVRPVDEILRSVVAEFHEAIADLGQRYA